MSRSVRRLVLVAALATVALCQIPNSASASSMLNVPGDFPTIQAAIAAAAPGDTVLVAAGIYRERIDFLGKEITVASTAGAAATTIDGSAAGRVVSFTTGEGRGSVLEGFTIRNGAVTEGDDGAGIGIFNSSPTIEDDVITGNSACADGGGIYVSAGAPLIEGNVITNNAASDHGCYGGAGGGIFLINPAADGGTPQVTGNTISGNRADYGGALAVLSSPTVQDNVISGNSSVYDGGGIWNVNGTSAAIVQNLVVNNRSTGNGGGISFSPASGAPGPDLVNNTFAGNTASGDGSAVWTSGFPAASRLSNNVLVGASGEGVLYCDPTWSSVPPVLDHNDAFSTSGGVAFDASCAGTAGSGGNISADPLFVGSGSFQLQAGSPAIDAGNSAAPDLPAADLAGNPRVVGPAVDMGVYEAGTPAAAPAVAAFSPASVDFGSVSLGSAVRLTTVTLTNTGGSPLQVTVDQVQTPAGVFSLGADGCVGATLAPGASCAVQVGLQPSSVGAWSGALQVTDTVGFQSVPLAVTVVAGQAAPNPPSWSFGIVRVGRQSRAVTIHVSNSGTGPLHIGVLSMQGANAGDFPIVSGGTTCSNATVQVGAACTVQIVFVPTAKGTRSASLSVASDDPASPTTVPLTGTGG